MSPKPEAPRATPRPRMSPAIRRGLDALCEFGRSWLEADGGETPEGMDADNGSTIVADIEAAQKWIAEGGLS